MKAKELAILVLAAGASSRMGEPKQLLSWGKKTLLNHAIDQTKKLSSEIYVVLGANKSKIAPTLPSDITIIDNPEWKKGMGTSIAKGVSQLKISANYEAVLIVLADQPFLDAEYLLRLRDVFNIEECLLAATRYGQKNGVPAIFHKSLFEQLTELNEDVGAKHVMKRYLNKLVNLDPDGKEVDIDTLATYQKLIKQTFG